MAYRSEESQELPVSANDVIGQAVSDRVRRYDHYLMVIIHSEHKHRKNDGMESFLEQLHCCEH